jgi:hypothetical protein
VSHNQEPKAKRSFVKVATDMSLKEAVAYPGAIFIRRAVWVEAEKNQSVRVNNKEALFSMVTIEDALADDWFVEKYNV